MGSKTVLHDLVHINKTTIQEADRPAYPVKEEIIYQHESPVALVIYVQLDFRLTTLSSLPNKTPIVFLEKVVDAHR
jgi:hypothetical protein